MTQKSKGMVLVEQGPFSLEVGHLNLNQLGVIRSTHAARFFECIEEYTELLLHTGNFQRTYGFALVLIEMADAIADCVALTNPDLDREKVSALPVGLQMRALLAVLNLSVGSQALSDLDPHIASIFATLNRAHPNEIN